MTINTNYSGINLNQEFDPEIQKNNIKAAEKAMTYVLSKVRYSTTLGTGVRKGTKNDNINSNVSLEDLRKKREIVRKKTDELERKQPLAMINDFVGAAIEAELAEKYGFANCDELSCMGFFHMLKENNAIRVDVFEIGSGDHVIMVVGRSLNSDPKDYKTFGPNAIVLDIYAEKIFPASEIENQLIDYKGLDQNGCPILEKFDSAYQSLKLITSNAYSAKDFQSLINDQIMEYSDIDCKEIENLLTLFHTSYSKNEKSNIAKKLIKKIESIFNKSYKTIDELQRRIKNLKAEKNLISQLEYFLNPNKTHEVIREISDQLTQVLSTTPK